MSSWWGNLSGAAKSGWALALVIVAIIAYAAYNNSKVPSGTCTLSAPAVLLIADGMKAGDTPEKIVTALGGLAATAVCQQAVKDIVNNPGSSVSYTNGSTTKSATGNDLLNAAFYHNIKCFADYNNQTEVQECQDYRLPP